MIKCEYKNGSDLVKLTFSVAADGYEMGERGGENSVIDLTDHSLTGGPGSS